MAMSFGTVDHTGVLDLWCMVYKITLVYKIIGVWCIRAHWCIRSLAYGV